MVLIALFKISAPISFEMQVVESMLLIITRLLRLRSCRLRLRWKNPAGRFGLIRF